MAAIAAMTLGYRHAVPTTAIIAVIAAASTITWHARTDLFLSVTAVVIGPLAEIAAIRTGLWQYANPSFAGLPLWTLPMWWIYPVAVVRLVEAITGSRPRPRSLGFSAAMMILSVAWLCAFGAASPRLAVIGTIIMIAAIHRRHRSRVDIASLVVCGVIGPIAELLPVTAGAWSYANGQVLGLPIWLLPGYAAFGTALIHTGLAIAHNSAMPSAYPVHNAAAASTPAAVVMTTRPRIKTGSNATTATASKISPSTM
jgi:uncharacterized membrane protein YoaT (DUF817 family)